MTETFVMAGETPLHIIDSATEGEPIIILHGYMENMVLWEDFLCKLAIERRVIMMDIPGHGISLVNGQCHTMDYLAQCVHFLSEKLGLDSYFVLGYDLGGYIAMSLMEHYPKEVKGMIIVSALLEKASKDEEIAYKLQKEKILCDKRITVETERAQKMFFNKRRFAQQTEDLKEVAQTCEKEGMVALLEGMLRRKDSSDIVRQNSEKIHFIYGKEDELLNRDKIRTSIEKIGNVQMEFLEESGHAAYIEKQEEVLKKVLEYTK